MSENPKPPDVFEDTRTVFNIAYIIARTWGVSVEVFLHRDVGIRYPGFAGLGVLLLIPAYGCFWGGYDLRLLAMFFFYFLLACFVHRSVASKRQRRGEMMGHSYYNGFPFVCRLFKRLPESTAKRVIEPLLLVGVGAGLALWNPPLGCYLIGGGFSLALVHGAEHEALRQQALDMNDALIEQQILVERFREINKHSF